MQGVCFCREPKRWEQDQWSCVFSNFGITDIWELGKGGDEAARGKDASIYQPTTALETCGELPTAPALVLLAPVEGRYVQGVERLIEFEHPADAIYLFGGSHINLTDELLGGREPDHKVFIPTVKYELYAHAAAYITLYDRLSKRG